MTNAVLQKDLRVLDDILHRRGLAKMIHLLAHLSEADEIVAKTKKRKVYMKSLKWHQERKEMSYEYTVVARDHNTKVKIVQIYKGIEPLSNHAEAQRTDYIVIAWAEGSFNLWHVEGEGGLLELKRFYVDEGHDMDNVQFTTLIMSEEQDWFQKEKNKSI